MENSISKEWMDWLNLAHTKFGLTNADVNNILNQRKKDANWQPTSNSGKKTFWAWIVWMDLRPEFKKEKEAEPQEVIEVTE